MISIVKKFILPTNSKISKNVIRLAFPVIIGNLSRVLMSVVDVAMVGRLGVAALAATGMGVMLFWGALSFVIGIRTATQTLASRRLGQKKFNECGTALHNGLVMALLYGLPVSWAGFKLAEKVVPFFLSESESLSLCINYTSIIYISLIFSSVSFVLQGFFTGIEKTKTHMNVSITSNIVNVYLNAGLIYGSSGVDSFFTAKGLGFISGLWTWYDFPALGVRGAAIATLIASIWMLFHYMYYLFSVEARVKYKTLTPAIDLAMMKRQLKLAIPQSTQEVAITVGWSIYYKIMGMIGLLELATTELIFTIMHASFMPALGVGQACATLVGKHMGEENIEKAEISIWESVRWAEIIMGTMGLVFILLPEFILSFFTNDPEVIHLGIFGLRILGLLQFIDAIGFTLWFALSGAGNTFFPAVVESALVWLLLLPVSYITGIILGYGFYGPWLVFPVYLIIFSLVLYIKIRKGDWKDIKV